MTIAVTAPERRAPRRRAAWAVLLGVLPLIIAGHAMAAGGALPVATLEGAAPVPSASPLAEPVPAPSPVLIAEIAAPGTLQGADYTASIQQITIKFPPPPEPPASAGGSRGGGGKSGSGGGGGGGVINYKTWCANNGPAYSASSASSMLTAINNERARNGAPALKWSNSLAAGAQEWSDHMAATGEWKHSPNPGAGENLFKMSGGSSWSLAHSELMKSDGHCANIMNPALKTFGVAVADGVDGWWYLTQRYGR